MPKGRVAKEGGGPAEDSAPRTSRSPSSPEDRATSRTPFPLLRRTSTAFTQDTVQQLSNVISGTNATVTPLFDPNEPPWLFHWKRQDIVAVYMGTSTVGRAYEFVFVSLAAISVIVYVVSTYSRTIYDVVLELVISLAFLFDYLFALFLAENKCRFIFGLVPMSDVIVIVSSIIDFVFFFVTSDNDPFLNVGFLRIARIVRLVRLLRLYQFFAAGQSDVSKNFGLLMISVIGLIFTFAGLVQIVENTWGDNPLNADDGEVDFHDVFYFLVVSISTVGYGDFSPNTIIGKYLIVLMISLGLFVILPLISNHAIESLNMRLPYGGSFSPSTRTPHVVVCGDLDYVTVDQFIHEFFSGVNGNQNVTIVLLRPYLPDALMKTLLHSRAVMRRVEYLHGNAMNTADLRRAAADRAQAVFVLGNMYKGLTKEQDSATVMRCMSVRTHAPYVPLYVQLMTSESKRHIDAWNVDNTVTTYTIQMSILAQSCLMNGFNTFITDLLNSNKPPHVKRDNFQPAANWHEEYLFGRENDIWVITFPPSYVGKTFGEAVLNVYKETNGTLFGLSLAIEPPESEDQAESHKPYPTDDFQQRQNGAQTAMRRHFILLNPGKMHKIQSGDIGFVIARFSPSRKLFETKRQRRLSRVAWVMSKALRCLVFPLSMVFRYIRSKVGIEESYKLSQKPRKKKTKSKSNKNGKKAGQGAQGSTVNLKTVATMVQSLNLRRASTLQEMEVNGTEDEEEPRTIAEIFRGDQSAAHRRAMMTPKHGTGRLRTSQNSKSHGYTVSQMNHDTVEYEEFVQRRRPFPASLPEYVEPKRFQMLDCPVRQEDVTRDFFSGSLLQEWNRTCGGHILICGDRPGLEHLVWGLRQSYMQGKLFKPIVVVSEGGIEADRWEAVSFCKELYVLRGSGVNEEDLVKAGCAFACKVVYPSRLRSQSSHLHENAEVHLIDYDAVLGMSTLDAYMGVAPNAMAEIVHRSNNRFVAPFIGVHQTDIHGPNYPSPSFAAGRIYDPSVVETLLFKAYFNPFLNVLVRLLTGGGGENYLVHKELELKQTRMYLIDVPRGCEGTEYQNLLDHCVGESMVPLALLRDPTMQWDEHLGELPRGRSSTVGGKRQESNTSSVANSFGRFNPRASVSLHNDVKQTANNTATLFKRGWGYVSGLFSSTRRFKCGPASHTAFQGLPWVYTNPAPRSMVHNGDKVFVLCPYNPSIQTAQEFLRTSAVKLNRKLPSLNVGSSNSSNSEAFRNLNHPRNSRKVSNQW